MPHQNRFSDAFLCLLCTICSICIVLQSTSLTALANTSTKNSTAPHITVLATHWTSYTYTENDRPAGEVFDLTRTVFSEANIPFSFSIQPWSRVLQTGKTRKNCAICGIGRIPPRENCFQWAFPLLPALQISFFKDKMSQINIRSLADARQYRVGVFRAGYTEDFLRTHNFSEKHIIAIENYATLLKMLRHGRIDLLLMGENLMKKELEAVGLPPDTVDKTLEAFSATEYLAFSNTTDSTVVQSIKDAYNRLKKRGILQCPSLLHGKQ